MLPFHHQYSSSPCRSFNVEQGSVPGTLNVKPDAAPSQLVLIDYQRTEANRYRLQNPQEVLPYLDQETISWVDIQGLGSEETLRQLGQIFNLHALVLETIVNVPQRPKVEDYGNQLLLVTQMCTLMPEPSSFQGSNQETTAVHQPQLVVEQVSFILEKNCLVTVQEEPLHDCFAPVRDRIHYDKGTIRKKGADYLLYALLDAIIDGFFPILERYGEWIDHLEDEVIACPTPQTLAHVHQVKRDLLTLRRVIWPQRELLATLSRNSSSQLSGDTEIYFRDCYDHTIQVLDMVETYRELAASLMDVYLSAVSNRMNEVMKTLTVISTIFIPLTFIAGIYGMNFKSDTSPWNRPLA